MLAGYEQQCSWFGVCRQAGAFPSVVLATGTGKVVLQTELL